MKNTPKQNLQSIVAYNSLLRVVFLLAIMAIFIVTPAFAKTYYMANNPCSGNSGWGDGSNNNSGTKAAPFLTLQYAAAKMSSNDTLIIDDGTYTGASNVIGSTTIPRGSGGAFTTIKAENDGEVVFDGKGTHSMFYVSNNNASLYWSFEGLIWANGNGSTVVLGSSLQYPTKHSMYVKFLRCGAYDTPNGNHSNWYLIRASYVLLEGCYGYGSGRYKFQSYHSDHIIFRSCVARHDNVDTTGSPNPTAGFSVYSSNYVKVQNCIAIDGDQSRAWVATDWQGAFAVFTTSGPTNFASFENCIGLNNHYGAISVAANHPTSYVTFDNVIVWDCDNLDPSGYHLGLNLNGQSGATGNYLKNITFGSSSVQTNWAPKFPTLKNAVFYDIDLNGSFWGWGVPTDNDYNSYYASTNNIGRTGTNDLTTTDPIDNSYLYLPRIESGSDLSGAGDGGADIGANVLTLIGKSGTFWNDAGYATDTKKTMWPFPNEDLIKSKMAAYKDNTHGISGSRGFCAAGKQLNGVDDITLTSYIWEYLRNPIPPEIYNRGITIAAPQNLRAIPPKQ